jgi:hypothetical protein
MVRRQYSIFADYFQFYLWDAGAMPEPPTDYAEADLHNRIKAGPFVVAIQPVRNMDVPVTLDIADAAPALDLAAWDHVAEASLELPSGRLEIHECTGGSIDILDIAPGSYRVRACFAGLGTLSEDGLDGDDRYHLTLWPAPTAPVAVLRQYTEKAA